MTIKLPEVGKRYHRKFDKKRTYVLVKIIPGEVSVTGCEEFVLRDVNDLNYRAFDGDFNYTDLTFWNSFEELPDQPTEEKPMRLFSPKIILNGATFLEIKDDKVLILGRDCFTDKDVEDAFRVFLGNLGFNVK